LTVSANLGDGLRLEGGYESFTGLGRGGNLPGSLSDRYSGPHGVYGGNRGYNRADTWLRLSDLESNPASSATVSYSGEPWFQDFIHDYVAGIPRFRMDVYGLSAEGSLSVQTGAGSGEDDR
jgi:hypothetical protein